VFDESVEFKLRSMQTQTTGSQISPIAPIDPTPIVTHGESPTAIILAIAILIVLSLSSLTQLIRVIVMAMRQTKPQR
jgi:hypothetical protein